MDKVNNKRNRDTLKQLGLLCVLLQETNKQRMEQKDCLAWGSLLIIVFNLLNMTFQYLSLAPAITAVSYDLEPAVTPAIAQ